MLGGIGSFITAEVSGTVRRNLVVYGLYGFAALLLFCAGGYALHALHIVLEQRYGAVAASLWIAGGLALAVEHRRQYVAEARRERKLAVAHQGGDACARDGLRQARQRHRLARVNAAIALQQQYPVAGRNRQNALRHAVPAHPILEGGVEGGCRRHGLAPGRRDAALSGAPFADMTDDHPTPSTQHETPGIDASVDKALSRAG